MKILELKGYINEQGQLEVDLPKNIPSGEVKIKIEFPVEGEVTEKFKAMVDRIIKEQKPLLDELAKR